MAEEPSYGFDYEKLWIVDKLLDVLEEEAVLVRYEGPNDLDGVEAVIETTDGESWIQAKHRSSNFLLRFLFFNASALKPFKLCPGRRFKVISESEKSEQAVTT